MIAKSKNNAVITSILYFLERVFEAQNAEKTNVSVLTIDHNNTVFMIPPLSYHLKTYFISSRNVGYDIFTQSKSFISTVPSVINEAT